MFCCSGFEITCYLNKNFKNKSKGLRVIYNDSVLNSSKLTVIPLYFSLRSSPLCHTLSKNPLMSNIKIFRLSLTT